MSTDVVRQELRNGVLVLVIDNPPVNASSSDVRAGLLAGIRRLVADEAAVGAVLIGSRGSFVAGSDISEFGGPVPEPLLPTVIAEIESCPKPVVAAIEGVALGGGLELALGCDARVASATARLGLPEVTLGMVPGAGGTQRLPRLMGRAAALALIVDGRRMTAQEALEYGVVDQVCTGDVLEASIRMARSAAKRRVMELSPPLEAPGELEAVAARALARSSRPQVRDAIELVRGAGTVPADEAMKDERARFDRHRSGPDAAALRHLFFAERKAFNRAGARPATDPITRAAVIGAGSMGVGIAVALATHGTTVHLVDADPDQAARGLEEAHAMVARAVNRGRMSEGRGTAATQALSASSDMINCADAQLIVEAVVEEFDVKVSVLRAAESAAPTAVLASNTSYLGIGQLALALRAPDRLLGLHFFNPADRMRLVEVVSGSSTAPDALAVGLRVVRDLGKQAVLAGDREGFIGNRIFSVYRRHAEYLLEDGALPPDVDAALEAFGFAMGPFAVADLSGLQIAQAMRQRWDAEARRPRRYVSIPDLLCEQGRLGRRTFAGYYAYDQDGGPRRAEPVVHDLIVAESARKGIRRRNLDSRTIVRRTMAALVVEGCRAVADGTAAHPDDVDVVLVNGYGFPRWRGGPMWWAAQQDHDVLFRAVAEVADVAQEEDQTELVRSVFASGPKSAARDTTSVGTPRPSAGRATSSEGSPHA